MAPVWRELLANEYFCVLADDAARVVKLVRTPLPFASREAMEGAFAQVDHATAAAAPVGWGFLLDSREGPMRNDPEFEEAFARVRRPILKRFSHVAVLMKSAVGKLQVARYGRETQSSQPVFDDEAKALAFLRGAK